VTSLSFTVPAEFLDALTDTVAERVPKLQARRAIPAPGLHHLERQRVAGHPPLKLRPLLIAQHDLKGLFAMAPASTSSRRSLTHHDRTSNRAH
jgi:hypothetical protein